MGTASLETVQVLGEVGLSWVRGRDLGNIGTCEEGIGRRQSPVGPTGRK